MAGSLAMLRVSAHLPIQHAGDGIRVDAMSATTTSFEVVGQRRHSCLWRVMVMTAKSHGVGRRDALRRDPLSPPAQHPALLDMGAHLSVMPPADGVVLQLAQLPGAWPAPPDGGGQRP